MIVPKLFGCRLETAYIRRTRALIMLGATVLRIRVILSVVRLLY